MQQLFGYQVVDLQNLVGPGAGPASMDAGGAAFAAQMQKTFSAPVF